MTTPIRWGILGTGNIARQFARDLALLPDATLVAVGSRTQASADAFGATFAVPQCYDSYAALAADPDVDAVYVATPHTLHHDNTLACLEAGKAVLCEKPFALNAAETRAMIADARARGLFLMEAMWTRFIPAFVRLRAWLAEGVLGDIRLVQADIGFQATFDPHGRLFDPALGGGALLDIGIYPVSLASLVLGTPNAVSGHAHLGSTGVDEQATLALGHADGAVAALLLSFQTDTPREATIIGSKGWLRIHATWWHPTTLTLALKGQAPQVIELPYAGNGYQYEAAEVMHCMRAGVTESAVMPLNETQTLMETLDALRAQWGLRYPGE